MQPREKYTYGFCRFRLLSSGPRVLLHPLISHALSIYFQRGLIEKDVSGGWPRGSVRLSKRIPLLFFQPWLE